MLVHAGGSALAAAAGTSRGRGKTTRSSSPVKRECLATPSPSSTPFCLISVGFRWFGVQVGGRRVYSQKASGLGHPVQAGLHQHPTLSRLVMKVRTYAVPEGPLLMCCFALSRMLGLSIASQMNLTAFFFFDFFGKTVFESDRTLFAPTAFSVVSRSTVALLCTHVYASLWASQATPKYRNCAALPSIMH